MAEKFSSENHIPLPIVRDPWEGWTSKSNKSTGAQQKYKQKVRVVLWEWHLLMLGFKANIMLGWNGAMSVSGKYQYANVK